jgi:hypothetical protein
METAGSLEAPLRGASLFGPTVTRPETQMAVQVRRPPSGRPRSAAAFAWSSAKQLLLAFFVPSGDSQVSRRRRLRAEGDVAAAPAASAGSQDYSTAAGILAADISGRATWLRS